MKKILFALLSIILISTTAHAQQTNTYAVVVSFGSMCCGVPSNEPVMKLIKSFKKQYKI